MKLLQWVPLVATLGVLYVLRWSHVGVTNFKVFVLIVLIWSLLLILFYRRTRAAQLPGARSGGAPEAAISKED